ncbi:hypothetical protein [Robbsia andropogonis]|uniref:hypothetical protein n=1 Tax=Robbsia andropogonis TaxID=28092 RepID=UPI0012F9B9FE|nr:hypothetical protein [Robbsia andropogonis]
MILQAVSLTGQNRVAEEIQRSPATISRWLSQEDEMPRCCEIIAALNLKVVPKSAVCVSQRTFEAYKILAAEHMRAVSREEQLSWDE